VWFQDHPVGTGTGLYNRQQLFITRKKHASFIPLLGLIRADDFNHASPAKPKISKPEPSQPVSILSYSVEYNFQTYKDGTQVKMHTPKSVKFDMLENYKLK
jgi:hypothetical protein